MQFNIRKATLEDARNMTKVQIATWKSAYKNILDPKFLDHLSIDTNEEHRQKTINVEFIHNIVAESEDGLIVGFAICGDERSNDPIYKGEVSAIYVLDEFQRMGVGKKLLTYCIECLLKDGIRTMKIWVLKDNSYQNFYKKMGGVLIGEKKIKLGGKKYAELAFGWQDLNQLAIRLKSN